MTGTCILGTTTNFESSVQPTFQNIMIFRISTKIGRRFGPGVIWPTGSILGLLGTVYSLATLELKELSVALYPPRCV
jgi:hypothetical protein